jgi:hypothetical protein
MFSALSGPAYRRCAYVRCVSLYNQMPRQNAMSTQTRASWIFGGLFVAFILGVFAFGPESLPGYKQQLLAYICALLAGCFALFFTGALLLNADLPIAGKWTVQGGAGFALFLVVLFWWQSPTALIKKEGAGSPKTSTPTATASPTQTSAADGENKVRHPSSGNAKAAPPMMVNANETYTSDDVASGACKDFGGWATVCTPDKPEGWTIVDQHFELTGDRAGCQYARCEPVAPITETKACYHFQTQGHDEECGHSGNTGIHYSKGVLRVVWRHPVP